MVNFTGNFCSNVVNPLTICSPLNPVAFSVEFEKPAQVWNEFSNALLKKPHQNEGDAVSAFLSTTQIQWEKPEAVSEASRTASIISYLADALFNFGYKIQAFLNPNPNNALRMYQAIENNNERAIQILINAGFDVNQPDEFGNTPLHWAVKNNNERAVQILIDADADVNQPDEDGNTPLHWAVKNNNERAMQILIDAGADVNQANKFDNTPLYRAVENNNKRAVQILIDAGALRTILFLRKHFLDRSFLDPELFLKVLTKLIAERPANIDFDPTGLDSFDDKGTCSAMALDFASRYNSKCTASVDKIQCVIDFKPYYLHNTEEYTSMQTAYNTIQLLDKFLDISDCDDACKADVLAHEKMQSLANYHDMTLTPVTKTLDWESLNDEELGSIIDNLPKGTYVIRMIQPNENHKKESYGHTMVFVKEDDFQLYYDNGKSLRLIPNQEAEGVVKIINQWTSIPTLRIYKATCPSEGCTNLAELPTTT